MIEQVSVAVNGQTAVYDWNNGAVSVQITSGGEYRIAIKENNSFCNEAVITVVVTEENFVKKGDSFTGYKNEAVMLSDLFEIRTDNVAVTVTAENGEAVACTVEDRKLFVPNAGKFTVKIEANGNANSNTAQVELVVYEYKFEAVAVEDKTVGTPIKLSELVSGNGVGTVSVIVKDLESGTGYSIVYDNEQWTNKIGRAHV